MKSLLSLILWPFIICKVEAAATILIKGKLALPSIPLHMLIGQMLAADSSLDQDQFRKDQTHPGRDFSYPGQKIGTSHYPPLQARYKFPYPHSFQVLAVALKGPHREQQDFSNPDLAKQPFFVGTINEDGLYSIEAPVHPGEYLVVIQSYRACFKRLVIASGMEGAVINNQTVDIESTVLADLNLWLEGQGIFLPHQKVQDMFQHVLKEYVILMEMDLREGKISPRTLGQYGLMAFARALEIRLSRKRFDDPNLTSPRRVPEYDLSFLGSTQKLQKLLTEVWRELKHLKRPRQVLLSAKELREPKIVHPKVFNEGQLYHFPTGLRSWTAKISSISQDQDQGPQRYSQASDEMWRMQGNWKKTASIKNKNNMHSSGRWIFDHYWRQVSSPMKIDGKCTFEYNSSGGTRWKWSPLASHGFDSQPESYLISPSVQLSHFPLEEEDIVSAQEGTFASWVSGTWKGLEENEVIPGLAPCSQYTRTITQNARLRSQGEAGLKKSQFRDAARANHWGHLHFQSKLSASLNKSQYQPKVEYSLDNGNTWQEAWWYKDEFHRGQMDRWWGVEIDLFADSDFEL